MIDKTLKFLQERIKAQFVSHAVTNAPEVILSALPKDPDSNPDDKIYITFLNMEEEKVLKNLATYQPLPSDPTKIGLMNPEIRLNLYVLITAQFSPARYETALRYISQIISFFQGQYVFEESDFALASSTSPTGTDFSGFEKLIVELFSPSFDQNNQIWPTLGSKLVPFALYKVRLVALTDKDAAPVSTTAEVQGIDFNLHRK